ncbi:MAG: beta-ketoacyl-ACP synthase II [Acidobacteriota bacterium]
MRRRVVVTGLGLVSPVGLDVPSSWEALVAGRSGIGPITRFDVTEFPSRIAGEIKDFDPLNFLDKKTVRKVDRFITYAIAAGDEAARMARLETGKVDRNRIGVFIGSGIGGFETIEREHRKFLEEGPRKISPFFIPASIINEAAGYVSIRLNAAGPNVATVTACAAGAHAIGEAFKIIERGEADVMVAGGAEAAITPMGVGGFAAMKALSTRNDEPTRASRPFDRDRDGFVVGEGAGILILEELEHALRRDVEILAEIVGFGQSGDAFHITAPPEDGEGAARAMQAALDDAGLSPAAIGYINAHGTSTPANDPIETRAIKKVFGEHAYRLAVSSTKSMTGHLLGAAGGLEAVVAVLALRHGILPPTINLENPDPECDLDYVPNQARAVEVEAAMSNSFGFGGTNVALVFRRYNGR